MKLLKEYTLFTATIVAILILAKAPADIEIWRTCAIAAIITIVPKLTDDAKK